jgi:hypothetical protein
MVQLKRYYGSTKTPTRRYPTQSELFYSVNLGRKRALDISDGGSADDLPSLDELFRTALRPKILVGPDYVGK